MEAEPEYRRAIELNPKNAQAYMNLGFLLGLLNRRDDAELVYREFVENLPDNPSALNGLAYDLADRGVKLDEALDLARRAVSLAPMNPDIVDTLAWVLIKRGELSEVESLLNEAVRLYGDTSGASNSLYHLGVFRELKGLVEEAKEAYREALKRSPEMREAKDALNRLGG